MSQKAFSLHDLISLWHLSIKPNQTSFIKLQVESNPILIQTFKNSRIVPIVTNVRRLQHSYIGFDIEEWWGWKVEEMMGGTVQNFMEFVHADDLIVHHKANQLLAYAFESGSYEEKMQLKLSFSYRLKTKNGQYILIRQTSSVLEIDHEGNFQTALTLLQEVKQTEDYPKHYIHLFGINTYNQVLEFVIKEHKFYPIENLSEREIEIAKHLLAGLDSKQISDYLSISRHTVDTHRRKILQKLL